MNEWNYSGTIAVDPDTVHIGDFLFYFLGKWYSSAEILELVTNAIESFANIVADALRGLVEWIECFMSERLPEITEIIETVCKKHKRNRWLPVRYIGVNDRRTDRRPQVHRIRNALPNMHKDRRMKRKGGTKLNPKDYLKQYRESLDRIQSLEEHMYELRAESESLQTPHGERVRLDAAVANLVDIEQEIACQTELMKQLQQEVSRMILKVADPDQRVLLTLVYIEGKSLVDAADIMTYSYRQAKRIHRHALHDVANILAEDAQACN